MSNYPESTAQRLCEIALAEVGYIEQPVNVTKYGKDSGADGLPWCGSFVMWCATKIGLRIPSVVSTAAGAQKFKDRNKWSETPERGYLAFMDFPNDGIDRISHIGIVVDVKKNSIICVEGNTSGRGRSAKWWNGDDQGTHNRQGIARCRLWRSKILAI
jgi:hypothetical protein